MPAVVRLGDKCKDHPGFSPRPSITGSPDTFVNDRAVVRVGDKWQDTPSHPHPGTQTSGSPTSFANDKAIARIGDSISCGSKNGEGSPDTFADGE